MKKTLKELAQLVEGRIIVDENVLISEISSLDEAKEGEITFLSNPKYRSRLNLTSAAAIIVPPEIKAASKPILLTKNPHLAYQKIIELFHPKSYQPKGIDPQALIGKGTEIGRDVSIYPLVFIGEDSKIGDRAVLYPLVFVGDRVVIGDDTLIYPNVTIREGCRIGKKVIIHSGSVIGSDGFGFAPDGSRYQKIPQLGVVQIDDDVEIGAGNTIDRATFGKTWIKRGTKTDNLVQIGHNVVIGEDTIIVGQVGISGSTEIGNHVTLAGQVGVAGHLKIGDGVTVGAKSGVTKDIPGGQVVSGFPPLPHRDWLRSQKSIAHLPEMRKAVRELTEKIKELEERFKGERC